MLRIFERIEAWSESISLGHAGELALLIQVLAGQTTLIEHYLIRNSPTLKIYKACLKNISNQVDISKDCLNFSWSLCISIPETINNFVSCFSEGNKLVGFGFGIIIGSGVFDFTFALGISALTSYFYHKQEISLKIEGIIWLILLYISSVIYVTYISSLADLKLYHLVFLLCCIPFTYEVFKLSSSYSSGDGKDFQHYAWDHANSKKEKSKKEPRRDSRIYRPPMLQFPGESGAESGSDDEEGLVYSGSTQPEKDTSLMTMKTVNMNDSTYAGWNTNKSYYSNTNSSFIEENLEDEVSIIPRKPEAPKEPPKRNFLIDFVDRNIVTAVTCKNCCSRLINVLGILTVPWKFLFDIILPIESMPVLAFFLIVVSCFFLSSMQVELADRLIEASNFSHNFVGLTFFSWFGNQTDVQTVITATKNKEFELAFATIYASQIINIQFALVFPWTLKCLYYGTFNLQGAKMFDSLIMVLFVLASTVVCLIWFRFKLNLNLFAALVTIYFGYVVFEYRKQYG